jgi:hypothetical protein
MHGIENINPDGDNILASNLIIVNYFLRNVKIESKNKHHM